MRTLQQIQRQEGVGYAQAKRVQILESKSQLASASGSEASCACVHPDPYECARIRYGRHAPDDDDYYKRNCECDCHERTPFYGDDY